MNKFLSPKFLTPSIAGFLSLFLIWGVVSHINKIHSGTEILVPVTGYDPRDILLGHYVLIRPNLSQTFEGEAAKKIVTNLSQSVNHGGRLTAWVVVRHGPDPAEIIDVFGVKPDMPPPTGFAYMKSNLIFRAYADDELFIAADIDIDRFYTNQVHAMDIETRLSENIDRPLSENTGIQMILSVGKDGVPRLKGLDLQGERVETSWW